MIVCCVGAGLVVPDVPLEETEILRSEATKHGIELVWFCLSAFFSHHAGLHLLNWLLWHCHTDNGMPVKPDLFIQSLATLKLRFKKKKTIWTSTITFIPACLLMNLLWRPIIFFLRVFCFCDFVSILLGSTYYTNHPNRENEGHCGSFWRLYLPCKWSYSSNAILANLP